MAIQTYGGAKLLLFSDICKKKSKKRKKKCIFATKGTLLGTALQLSCIEHAYPYGRERFSSATYQLPISTLSGPYRCCRQEMCKYERADVRMRKLWEAREMLVLRRIRTSAYPHIRISARWLLNVLRWLTLFDGFCACRVDF